MSSTLLEACARGNVQDVATLVNTGQRDLLNYTPETGYIEVPSPWDTVLRLRVPAIPLYVAIAHGHLDVVHELRKLGARVYYPDDHEVNPMEFAMMYGHRTAAAVLGLAMM